MPTSSVDGQHTKTGRMIEQRTKPTVMMVAALGKMKQKRPQLDPLLNSHPHAQPRQSKHKKIVMKIPQVSDIPFNGVQITQQSDTTITRKTFVEEQRKDAHLGTIIAVLENLARPPINKMEVQQQLEQPETPPQSEEKHEPHNVTQE